MAQPSKSYTSMYKEIVDKITEKKRRKHIEIQVLAHMSKSLLTHKVAKAHELPLKIKTKDNEA